MMSNTWVILWPSKVGFLTKSDRDEYDLFQRYPREVKQHRFSLAYVCKCPQGTRL